MIRARSLGKSYAGRDGGLVVLRDVSMSLDRGESAVIMGPSGSGKSTFLNILGTLERPDRGELTIDDVNPFTLSEDKLSRFRNQTVGFVFQDHHLLPQCTVLENVLLPTLAFRGAGDPLPRAKWLLERVGLTNRSNHLPAELSGGERQRSAMARAMINQPALLLADEPTGNLDRRAADAVADLMMELHRRENTVLVVVTHSEKLAERFERRLELADGALVPLGDVPNAPPRSVVR